MTELDRKLAKAARECSAEAVRETWAAGRPICIVRETWAAGRPICILVGRRVVLRWEDGREELVEELPEEPRQS